VFGFFKQRSQFRRMSDRMRVNNVREMLKLRLSHDPVARSTGIDPDELDEPMVEGLPEMTVFKEVQCYLMFRGNGASDAEAMQSLYEMHKPFLDARGPAVGAPPSPLRLQSWILFIVRVMHAHGAPISESHIKACISISGETYSAYEELLRESEMVPQDLKLGQHPSEDGAGAAASSRA
jgi:hypothetical protein